MAPSYRTATQTRRGNRSGFPEHDDFEGLPVRHWRQEIVHVAAPRPTDSTQQDDLWANELPYGMPKDYQLLPPHSQELLRAARSGRLYKRFAPAEEDEADPDTALNEKPEKKEGPEEAEGFTVKTWKLVPRNAEGPSVSHLAKRRKGTVTIHSKAVATPPSGPTVTRATVRRIDAAGNPYTQEVVLSDGQQVQGEIISTTVVPLAAPTHSAQAPPAPTPVKKRPPPPKKKGKAGRGRWKGRGRLPLPATTHASSAQNGTGLDGAAEVKGEAAGPDAIKAEGDNDAATNVDSDMPDASVLEDEERDEGDDGEEGGEGEGGNEHGATGTPEVEHEGEGAHEPEPSAPAPPVPEVAPPKVESESPTGDGDVAVRPASPDPMTLAPPHNPLHLQSPKIEGSPLKNVMTQSPTEASPALSPTTQNPPAAPEPADTAADVQNALDSMANDRVDNATADAHAETSEALAAQSTETVVEEPASAAQPSPAQPTLSEAMELTTDEVVGGTSEAAPAQTSEPVAQEAGEARPPTPETAAPDADVEMSGVAEPVQEQPADESSAAAQPQAAEGPTDTPVDVPAGVPADASSDIAVDAPAAVSAEAAAEIPADIPADIPAEVPAEVPTDIPTEVPAEPPAEPPAEIPAERPAEVPAEVPAGVPAEIPVGVPAEVPLETSAEPPAETSTEVPADVPAEAAVDAPAKSHGDVTAGVPEDAEEEDDGPDLLGGLEAMLAQQAEESELHKDSAQQATAEPQADSSSAPPDAAAAAATGADDAAEPAASLAGGAESGAAQDPPSAPVEN